MAETEKYGTNGSGHTNSQATKPKLFGANIELVFDHISDNDAKGVLVILMIAELNDTEYVNSTAERIGNVFRKQLDAGQLEVIAPLAHFYPDLNSLKQTLGDTPERVYWRSKQNLDYAFLMMYATQRSSAYYVQLEDDILV